MLISKLFILVENVNKRNFFFHLPPNLLRLFASSQVTHSGAIYDRSLHRIIEINLSLPMESNCGFGS